MKIYKGISEGDHHKVITGVKWSRQSLAEFYLKFAENCLLPWNEFKKKYNPTNPYRKTLTDDFRQVYAPKLEGKELLEYKVIQDIVSQFNFAKPLGITDVQILSYRPGFSFVPHIDQEVSVNIMFPIFPTNGGEPLMFHQGGDFRNPGPILYKVYYDVENPTLTNGKIIHSVPKIANERVYLRLRTDGETYKDIIDKINSNVFI